MSPPCLRFTCCEKAERVHELNEEIGKLLAKAEQLGGEGNVDEAQQLLEKVEKTRILKKEAEVSNGWLMTSSDCVFIHACLLAKYLMIHWTGCSKTSRSQLFSVHLQLINSWNQQLQLLDLKIRQACL